MIDPTISSDRAPSKPQAKKRPLGVIPPKGLCINKHKTMLNDPQPASPLGQKLASIFSYPWKTIEGDPSIAGDSPNWRTIQNYPLRPRSLYEKFSDPSTLIGVRFGKTTTYGMIDVDRGSQYLNLAGLKQITEALEIIGIVRTIPIRSSGNGGIHLYIPLPIEVNTFDLASSLKALFQSQGITIAPATLELFPNVKSYSNWFAGHFSEYNAHRLPLQPGSGSAMLDMDYRAIPATLERFFHSWDFASGAQDMDLLLPALAAGRNAIRKRRKERSHPLESWLHDIDQGLAEGFTGEGQTNALLKDIACKGRVFLRLEGEALINYVQETVINLPGFDKFSKHQFDIGRRARAWALAAESYYWPLGEPMKRERAALKHNRIKSDDAQTRIAASFAKLAQSGELAQGVRARVCQLAEAARTSATTLYKYLGLWHPDHVTVTPLVAVVSDDSPPGSPPQADQGSPSEIGGLHSIGQLMKGVAGETGPESIFSKGREGVLGGEGGNLPSMAPG
jgi:hypothetical protein